MSDRAKNLPLPTTDDILPVLGPLLALLRSRKGILWIVGLVIMLIVAYVPAMQDMQEQLAAVLAVVFTGLTSMLILGIAHEDGAQKAAGVFPVDLRQIDFTPIWTPILNLLRSRKFVAAVGAVLVSFLITNIPTLESVETELSELLVFIIGLIVSTLMGAIAYEDGKTKQPAMPRVYAMPPASTYPPVREEIGISGGPVETTRVDPPINFEARFAQTQRPTEEGTPDQKADAA